MTQYEHGTGIHFDEGEEMEVVGESRYQENFVKLVGPKTEQGHHASVLAILVPEPENAHDPFAVVVRVDGRDVGHLPAEVAADYQAVLLRLTRETGCYAVCNAIIKGGWRRSGRDMGHFGITLTSFPSVHEIEATIAERAGTAAAAAPATAKSGCLGVLAAAAVLAYLLA